MNGIFLCPDDQPYQRDRKKSRWQLFLAAFAEFNFGMRKKLEFPARVLLRKREAAEAAGVGTRTIEALIANGSLRAVRVGRLIRVPVVELERFAARGGSTRARPGAA
ncbi:MAG: excisionase family DNA-binding protein [Terriglobales bacterium]